MELDGLNSWWIGASCLLKEQETADADVASYWSRLEPWLPVDAEARNRVRDALGFAFNAHEGMLRRSGQPYIVHPVLVAQILAVHFRIKIPDIIIAGLLHDVVEDIPSITLGDIRKRFGKGVAELVDGCTKFGGLSLGRKQLKDMTHDKLFMYASRNVGVLAIKLADRLHNMQTLDALPAPKRQRIAQETVDVYAPLAAALGVYFLKRELYDLSLIHLFPRQCKKLQKLIRFKELHDNLTGLARKLDRRLAEVNLPAQETRTRLLSFENFYSPERGDLNPANASDVAHMTIIPSSGMEADCYAALGAVNTGFRVIPRTIRDFIANPKSNGYKSLHVRLRCSRRDVLVKIRTQAMDDRANYGVFSGLAEPEPLSREHWREVRALLENLGSYKGSASLKRDLLRSAQFDEIVVHSPAGDDFYLPKGATALDFAFKVHTELGLHCRSAEADGQAIDATDALQDRQTVRIVTSYDMIDPSPDLEQACVTHRARAQISRLMAEKRRRCAMRTGRSLLSQALAASGLSEDDLAGETLELILELLKVDNLNDLYVRIGQDRLRPEVVPYYMEGARLPERESPGGDMLSVRISEFIPGVHKFAQCCSPFPGEENLLAGLSERGVTFHRGPGLKRHAGVDESRLYRVRWDEQAVWRWPLELNVRLHGGQSDVFSGMARLPGDLKVIRLEVGDTFERSSFLQAQAGSMGDCRAMLKALTGLAPSLESYRRLG